VETPPSKLKIAGTTAANNGAREPPIWIIFLLRFKLTFFWAMLRKGILCLFSFEFSLEETEIFPRNKL